MNLIEMFNDDINMTGYRTEEDDNTTLKLSDLRKSKLTLSQLHRLRIMHDIRKLEKAQDLKKVQAQFKPPAESMPA